MGDDEERKAARKEYSEGEGGGIIRKKEGREWGRLGGKKTDPIILMCT